ncbi:MAG: hypothetical protein JJU03_12345 [Idiomarina sp.]|nr:hypothetical protein [Idiomarina sp.]
MTLIIAGRQAEPDLRNWREAVDRSADFTCPCTIVDGGREGDMGLVLPGVERRDARAEPPGKGLRRPGKANP